MTDLRLTHSNAVEFRVSAQTEAARAFFAKHFGAGAVGVTVPKDNPAIFVAAFESGLSVG